MKKLSVLLVAMAVAVSAMAGVPFKKAFEAKKGIKAANIENTKVNIKSLKAKANATTLKAETPEGEMKQYNRTGQAVVYVSSWFGSYIEAQQQTDNAIDRVTIVYGENNQVYVKNILYGTADSYGENWVEGFIEGNHIYVPLGQAIYTYEDYGVDVVLGWGTTYIDEDGYFNIQLDERAQFAIYTINEDNTISLEGTDGPTEIDAEDDASYLATGLALVYAGNEQYAGGWDGFIEWNTVLTEHEFVPAPNIITEVPEGCEIYNFYRNSGTVVDYYGTAYSQATDGKFNVAIDAQNGKAYIQNPLWWRDNLDTWIEGAYDASTGIITVPTGQYLAWSEQYEYGIQVMWGSTYFSYDDEYYDDWYDEWVTDTYITHAVDDKVNEIQFQFNGEKIYLLNTSGNVYAQHPNEFESTGMMSVWSDDLSFDCDEFAKRDDNDDAMPFGYIVNVVPAVPANPTADDWYDCGNEAGYSKFYFTLPTTDIEGNMIEPENLSYRVYVDNGNGAELFTFPAADYTFDLTTDIDEVPYSLYSNAVDFKNYFVYMYRTNAEGYDPLFTENIGIQAIYTVDGIANASAIVWLYDKPVSVNEVDAVKTVANVRYYNVAGQQMAQPEGVTIKVITYTDGTTNTVKVVK